MTLRQALEVLLEAATTPEEIEVEYIATYVEKALDKLIDAMSAPHFCAMPQEVRARWHDVFVAAMMEES